MPAGYGSETRDGVGVGVGENLASRGPARIGGSNERVDEPR